MVVTKKKASNAKYRERNREKLRIASAEYNSRPEVMLSRKLKRKEQSRKKTEAAKRWKIANPLRFAELVSKSKKKNAGKILSDTRMRQAAKQKAVPAWANREKISDIYRQAKELETIMGVHFEVDHIVPLRSEVVCGFHCEDNLQILPAMANQSKGNRLDQNQQFYYGGY